MRRNEMKRMGKRITAAALIAVMAVATGCSKKPAAQDTPPASENVTTAAAAGEEFTFPLKEKKEITIGVLKRVLHTTSFDEMPLVQRWEEETNVHVNWVEIPESSYTEKANLAFASNNLADAYINTFGLKDNEIIKYAENGQIVPLNDYIDKYCPKLTEKFEKYPEVRSIATAPDGNIYALARSCDEGIDIPCFMYVNQTWLDKLNLKVPETEQEFYDMLVAFRDKDPNGNGKADEIPLSAIADFSKQDFYMFNLFGMFDCLPDPNGLAIHDGKVEFAPMSENWKKACTYFNKLYSEKLLDNECFTMKEQQYTAKGSGEDATLGVVLGWNAFNYVGSERAKEYTPIPFPAGPEGSRGMYMSPTLGVAKNSFFLTSECKDPELVMRWMDHVFYDNDVLSVEDDFGPVDYNLKKNADGVLEVITTSPEGMTFGEWRHKWSPATVSPIINNISDLNKAGVFVGNPNNMLKAEQCNEFRQYGLSEVMPSVYLKSEDVDTVSNLKNDLMDQALQMSARWISGESNPENDWASYQEQLKKTGVEQYVSIYQEAYDNYKNN